ncbi:MAG: phosphoribosylformylglycinamidine synthase [Candidatus Hydrogenedentes bacterium]|nr:phosphoribosylformylglycinamidine synthase [Candidatus Hydrogenedentota bacterium]
MHRVEVKIKPGMVDARGQAARTAIIEDLHIQVESVACADVYTIYALLTDTEIERVRTELLTDPVIQESSSVEPVLRDYDWLIEVGFRPGVTDNVGATTAKGIADVIGRPLNDDEGAFTSRQYAIKGDISESQANHIARDLLANELIQRWIVRRGNGDLNGSDRFLLGLPLVDIEAPAVAQYNLEVDDDSLIKLSRDGVLALELEEMHVIRDYFRRDDVRSRRHAVGLGDQPTDVELEAIAQTWSEHCKHKIFNATIDYRDSVDGTRETIASIFKTYVRGATEDIATRVDWLVSVFHDNAGVVRLDDRWNLVMKVETHNSPSALDPYGGAITGIVGVNRDPLGTGLGSKLIFNVDTFCFADPNYSGTIPERLLHPRRVFKGVHLGVRDGANQSGIPDVNGAIVFDDRYLGKPLVYCGTGAIMPVRVGDRPSHVKEVEPGDLIVMTGGRIGKDGIHGATFSSEELHGESPATAVQIGDPITQKKMVDMLLEARDLNLYRCITDNGAGGLSSSVGEMAQLSGGCEIHLDKAPLKYAGLAPWESLLSEAPERMSLAVPPDKIDAFLELAARRNVEATVLGSFTDTGKFHAIYEGRTVAYLDMDFLHEGLPDMRLEAEWSTPSLEQTDLEPPANLTRTLFDMLGRLNICSKESFVRQYDHEVQGGSALKPFVGEADDGPGDASIVRPLLGEKIGVVVACGICPRYSDIDTYHMMANAIDEAVRNTICVGGRIGRIAGLDNFCWPDPVQSEKTPDGKYKLAQLVRACKALYDYCTAYDLPCISGKDSMKNDYKIGDTKISIPPTVLFSTVTVMDDVEKAVSMDAKQVGDLVYVVGETFDELGGSEYAAMHGQVGANVPKVDAARARTLYETLANAIDEGLVASCHDASDGGLGVAMAETAFAGGFGMKIDLARVPARLERNDTILFSESASRFVVTVHEDMADRFENAMDGTVMARVGEVVGQPRFVVDGLDGTTVIDADIYELKEAWQKPLRW